MLSTLINQKSTLIASIISHLGWCVPLYIILSTPDLDLNVAAILSRSVFFFGALVSPLFVHYAALLIKPEFVKNRLYLTLQGFALLMPVFVLLGLVEKGVIATDQGIFPVFGTLFEYDLFAKVSIALLLGFVTWEIVYDLIRWKGTHSRARISLMTVGTIFVALFCNLILPRFFHYYELINLGPAIFFLLYLHIFTEKMGEVTSIMRFFVKCMKFLVYKSPGIFSTLFILGSVSYICLKVTSELNAG